MTFYTYSYIRQADGTPYYYGKGKGSRAICSSNHHVAVPESARIIVQRWANEQEALDMERWYIDLFGRKNKASGILRNLTDGGEGTSGTVVSRETRGKQRLAKIGRVLTVETRLRMRESQRKRRATHPVSEETRMKLRLINTGKKCQGHPHSEETKRRISEYARNRPSEHLAKIGARHKGKIVSPETRQKLRQSLKGRPWSEARRRAANA